MRLLLVAMVAVLAIGAAKAVDVLSNRVPVVMGKVRWKAEERSCEVRFNLQNRTLSPRTVVVFISLYAADSAAGKRAAERPLCGSTALRRKLKPLEQETQRVTVPTEKMAVDCEVEIEPEAK